MVVKIQLGSKNLYSSILTELKRSTNLLKIQKKLNISKQKLNYYLRGLKKRGLLIKKGQGWYEVVKSSKNSTKYGVLLKKDMIRGHAFIWNIKLPKEIEGWNNRINILKQKRINFKLVGALKTTPRIKALGRKVWLCNNHLRIFDKKGESYYSESSKQSRKLAYSELLEIMRVLENKLGFIFKPFEFSFQKEHYALIKNDLAIDQNRKGIITRISDKDGEWLLIDDSLERGGELETIGKKSYKVNKNLQKWWNKKKDNNFKIDDNYIQDGFKQTNIMIQGLASTQVMNAENIIKHQKVLDEMLITLKAIRKEFKKSNS